jgi:sterol desaturase/sphingolipid hydroxylase (fatty acid hydroxylase superfamily)
VESILLAFSTPFMVVLILAEMIYGHYHHKHLYTTGDTFINLLCTTWNFVNDLIFMGVTLLVLSWVNSFELFTFSSHGLVYWVLLFFLEDLAYYTLHCADHYIRLFWATHSTHHSSEKYNLTVAIRSSVFQPFYRFLFFIPIALLGFDAGDIFFMYAATQVYGFWVHTELIGKLNPVFEFIFVTPSHHRVHHASNPKYLDRNMGMVLIIWDRIFGTFTEEDQKEPVKFGLTQNVGSYNPLNVVFYEWINMYRDLKNAPNFKSIIGYIFGPPGWSHDGSRKTSKQMKAELETPHV